MVKVLVIFLCVPTMAYALNVQYSAIDSKEATVDGQNHTKATLSSRNQIFGLEYLGIGYNACKAKPYGDDIDHIDSGYQQPFITFIWDEKMEKEGVKQSSPEGVWLRHDATCHRDKQVRKAHSMRDITKIVDEEFSYSLNLGILNVNTKGGMSKVEKFMQKTHKSLSALRIQCSLYTTGMYMSHQWMLTKAAQTAVNKIHDLYKSKRCKKALKMYMLSPECRNYAQLWMDLINNFGTHVITRTTYGGKFMHIKSMEKDENKKSRGENSHKSTLVFALASVGSSKEEQKTKENKHASENNLDMLYVVGGEIIPDDGSEEKYSAWKESIPKNPMPIKMQLTPLRQFLPHELAREFVDVIELYRGCAKKENKYYCILPWLESTKL